LRRFLASCPTTDFIAATATVARIVTCSVAWPATANKEANRTEHLVPAPHGRHVIPARRAWSHVRTPAEPPFASAASRTTAATSRTTLLGLELLVAADIVRTVAASPSLTSVAILAAIVLIRTFLSFSLEVETIGRWPWQKRDTVAP
jgi:uncharacterized protein DUF1622